MIAALTGASALVACGGDGVTGAKLFDVEYREPRPGEVRITSPSSVGAGLVHFRLKNSGPSDHAAQLLRVTGDHGREDVLEYLRDSGLPGARTPSWIRLGGGAANVPAGRTVSVRQRLAEGDWYLVDTAAGFYERGGLVGFLATSGGSKAGLPGADARVTAREYSFTPRSIAPGSQSIRFDNRGRQPHQLIAVPVVPGRSVDEAKAYIAAVVTPGAASPPSPPPVDLVRTVSLAALDRGMSLVTTIRLPRGTWILACFLTDRTGGLPHATKGMVQDITVG